MARSSRAAQGRRDTGAPSLQHIATRTPSTDTHCGDCGSISPSSALLTQRARGGNRPDSPSHPRQARQRSLYSPSFERPSSKPCVSIPGTPSQTTLPVHILFQRRPPGPQHSAAAVLCRRVGSVLVDTAAVLKTRVGPRLPAGHSQQSSSAPATRAHPCVLPFVATRHTPRLPSPSRWETTTHWSCQKQSSDRRGSPLLKNALRQEGIHESTRTP